MKNRVPIGTFKKALAVVMVLGIAAAGSATAGDLPREAVLPLAMAQKAATAALEKCEKDGYKVTVTVADRGGNIRLLMRADGAAPHTQNSSAKKAYTAASMRRSTREMAELIVKVPSLQALREVNEKFLILGGGLPIEIDGEVVGGIGIGGAPGDKLDEACAVEGLKAVNANVKPDWAGK
jgi:uncharacterized protein GlcG (DUF336 family)